MCSTNTIKPLNPTQPLDSAATQINNDKEDLYAMGAQLHI